jgi:isopentenyl-diphosphate delta-isomerase
MSNINHTVSFDDEKLIVVNKDDEELDYKTKAECHQGHGILHRAFSIFIFNDKLQLLLQQRSEQKLLWPMFWSNSCCSHPRKGEIYKIATKRRLKEELGLETPLIYLYKFQYQASFGSIGSENELCSVFIGKTNETVSINQNEIAEWKFVDLNLMDEILQQEAQVYTPWFKMEWMRLRTEFMNQIVDL